MLLSEMTEEREQFVYDIKYSLVSLLYNVWFFSLIGCSIAIVLVVCICCGYFYILYLNRWGKGGRDMKQTTELLHAVA
jgi:uncharacterized membrane protein